jgi:hypothetical protein
VNSTNATVATVKRVDRFIVQALLSLERRTTAELIETYRLASSFAGCKDSIFK